eukprot:gene18083-21540_t
MAPSADSASAYISASELSSASSSAFLSASPSSSTSSSTDDEDVSDDESKRMIDLNISAKIDGAIVDDGSISGYATDESSSDREPQHLCAQSGRRANQDRQQHDTSREDTNALLRHQKKFAYNDENIDVVHIVHQLPDDLETQISSPAMNTRYWSSLGPGCFDVRNTNYMTDRKKIPTAAPLLELARADLLLLPKLTNNIAVSSYGALAQVMSQRCAQFVLVLNLMLPGPPFRSLVVYWYSHHNLKTSAATTPTLRLMAKFLAGNSVTRDAMLKLIPRVTEGSWPIKRAVGTTPVILGRKLTQRYYQGESYLEIDVNVGSNIVARNVTNRVLCITKQLVLDLGILLQGCKEDELPECILGGIRLSYVDTEEAIPCGMPA